MKAKCPYCTNGCDNCENGYFDVKIATGFLHTLKCQNAECGFENGGNISDCPDLSNVPVGKYKDKCVMCGAPTKWKLVGYSKD